MSITASHLYSYLQCPHRVWRDTFDDQTLKDPPNEFVQMLWERGTQYEKEIIESNKGELDILDLSHIPKAERAAKTREAFENKIPYIYQGRLEVEELVGEPDLLELQEDGEYRAIDIKSGMGREGQSDENEGTYKKHYALQLALYTDALVRLGYATHHTGAIWDSTGQIIKYDLTLPMGKRKNAPLWWNFYEETLHQVKALLKKRITTEPALGSVCNLCQWKRTCKQYCESTSCLSLVPELGRSRKEGVSSIARDISELADINVNDHVDAKGKTGIPGIGQASLIKFQRRAKLLATNAEEPLLLEDFTFPQTPIELYFDIEADPTQDIVYLHGVVERQANGTEQFLSFVAQEVSASAEEHAWQQFWDYIRSLPRNEWTMYYYSKYERTQYRSLAVKYPGVASVEEVEDLFDPEKSIDLYYDIVKPKTEWATYNYSVKTLAQFCGFEWRDTNPSGAASIQWFNEYCREKDPQKLQRILDYNEDDCIAMRIVKEYLEKIEQT